MIEKDLEEDKFKRYQKAINSVLKQVVKLKRIDCEGVMMYSYSEDIFREACVLFMKYFHFFDEQLNLEAGNIFSKARDDIFKKCDTNEMGVDSTFIFFLLTFFEMIVDSARICIDVIDTDNTLLSCYDGERIHD